MFRVFTVIFSGEEGQVRNPYKWISKKEEEKKKEKKKIGEKPHDSSQVGWEKLPKHWNLLKTQLLLVLHSF